MSLLVRSASLTDYGAVARELGLDPEPLVLAARLPLAALSNPDQRVPGGAVRRLLEASAERADAQDFGLRMAARRQLDNLGPVGLLVQEANDLGTALAALVRYVRFQNESLRLALMDMDDSVLVRTEILMKRAHPIRQSVELSIGVQHRIMQGLLGRHWRPLQVCFRHGAPRQLRTHRSVFAQVPLVFGADYDGIAVRRTDLAKPIGRGGTALSEMTRRYLDSLNLQTEDPWVDRTALLIKALLPAGLCSSEAVATQMGIDRRTLHRRLAREGSHFGQVLDQVRRELAPRYLAAADRSLADVAQMLGFSAGSALSRWFSAAFGCSLSQWRRAHSGL